MTDIGQLRAAIWIAALLVVEGCGAGGASTPPSAPPSAGPPTASPTVTAVAPTTPVAIVLEDAGVDIELPPGTYTSRVFRPLVELELPAGWLRDNATHPDSIRVVSAKADYTFAIRHIDFVQCGTTLLEHPTAAGTTELVADTAKLAPTDPADVVIGGLPASLVELPGRGPSPDGAIDPANGCVFSTGAAAFPAESGWTVLTAGDTARLVFLDVAGVTLLALGLSQAGDLAALRTATQPLFDGLQVGG